MRLLLVSSHGADPGYGGAERYVRDLAVGMGARGHRVTVLSAFRPRSAVSGIETLVLHELDWRDGRLRAMKNRAGDLIAAPWPRIGSLIAALQPELVHTSNLPGIGTGVWEVARRAGASVVHYLHDYYLLCPRTSLLKRDGSPCVPNPLLCGLRTRRLARWSGALDRVAAGSRHLLDTHAEVVGDVPSEVIRLPFVPLSGGPQEVPSKFRTLGYLGALAEEKGVRMLLEAAPALARSGVTLRIAGDGALRSEVMSSSEVDYRGRLEGEEVERFLVDCDAGVVPSLWQEPSGPPYTVLEWLAAGRPVLTSRRGGLAEAADHAGVVGFEPTPSALLEEVGRLREPGAWAEMVDEVPRIVDDTDVERWLDRHEALYDAALERSGGRS